MPKLVASGITLVVDIVRKPDETSHPGLAIIKKAEEIDAALIIVTPHEHEFVEVGSENPIPALIACSSGRACGTLQTLVRACNTSGKHSGAAVLGHRSAEQTM